MYLWPSGKVGTNFHVTGRSTAVTSVVSLKSKVCALKVIFTPFQAHNFDPIRIQLRCLSFAGYTWEVAVFSVWMERPRGRKVETVRAQTLGDKKSSCMWWQHHEPRFGEFRNSYYNHPTTKLREGNAFSLVCLSFCRGWGVPWDHYPWCIIPHCTGPSPSASDIWWPTLETCSKLFTSKTPPPPTQWYWHLVATEACTVGKLVIRILLECFLEVRCEGRIFQYYVLHNRILTVF